MIIFEDDKVRLEQIRAYINANLEKDLELHVLSEKFSISSDKLRRQFRIYFKKTHYQYILEKRMLKAYTYLHAKIGTVAEIGCMVGYADHSSFTRAFRRYFGSNPIHFLVEK